MLVVGLITLAAGYAADHWNAPFAPMALLFGLAMNFLGEDERVAPGNSLASRILLPVAVVLMGMRITLAQIVALGLPVFIGIGMVLIVAMSSAVLVSRRLGLGTAMGLLVGGAVGICGASAALAIATILGEKRINQAQLALVLIGISGMSALAMLFYPILAHAAGLSDVSAGFLMGAAIHDVAQAVGAGYAFSRPAGEIATIVKLSRVCLLVPVLIGIALALSRNDRSPICKGKIGVPWFVAGFFAVVTLNSLGGFSTRVADQAQAASTVFLAAAVAATGLRAPMQSLRTMGASCMKVIVASTLATLAAAMLVALLV